MPRILCMTQDLLSQPIMWQNNLVLSSHACINNCKRFTSQFFLFCRHVLEMTNDTLSLIYTHFHWIQLSVAFTFHIIYTWCTLIDEKQTSVFTNVQNHGKSPCSEIIKYIVSEHIFYQFYWLLSASIFFLSLQIFNTDGANILTNTAMDLICRLL